MLTSDQIRAGRALVRWSARELGSRAGISLNTVQRLEAANGIPSTSARTLAAIRTVLEAAGVIFIDANGGGPGVRLRNPDDPVRDHGDDADGGLTRGRSGGRRTTGASEAHVATQ